MTVTVTIYIYIILFQLPIALPFTLCIVSFLIVALTFYQKTKESLMALGIVVFGLFIYIICVLWKDKPKFIQEKMCKVLYSCQIIRDFAKKYIWVDRPLSTTSVTCIQFSMQISNFLRNVLLNKNE